MKLQVRNLQMDLDYTEENVREAICRRLFVVWKNVAEYKIVRKAVDARKKKVIFVLTAEVTLQPGVKIKAQVWKGLDVVVINPKPEMHLRSGHHPLRHRPVIVGSGPSGLFCALLLARKGYRPLMIEQGLDVDERVRRVERFWQEGVLDPYNNTQFGEGGAGTFSDGKLTTRIGDPRVDYVLQTFVEFGADSNIIYLKKPHVGTDVIRRIVKNIREQIIALGGEVCFSSELTDINVHRTVVKSIEINKSREILTDVVVLAVGNSARKIYRLFLQKDFPLIAKSFAVGVRVEHPQDMIDEMQYGDDAGHPALGPADYHFTYQDKATKRSAYTFCMCPGGWVVAAASDEGQVVTNGMSLSVRDSGFANSAIVATVSPSDWGEDILGGMYLQERLERTAFEAGGGNYMAPGQFLKDFMDGRSSESLDNSIATYRPGVVPTNLWRILPSEIAEVIFRAVQDWGKRMPEFLYEKAVLTGVETRTSAPVRMVRDEFLQSVGIKGLYPCGEGAGYAGGIVSAAVDGLKVAEQIITTYAADSLTVP